MEAYIVYVYIMIVAGLCCLFNKKAQKYTSVLLLLFMMLMCGIRGYDVGTDTPNYVAYAIANNVEGRGWGPLYVIMKWIANFFDNSQTAFLMIMAILTYLPLMFIVTRKSEYPALSVFMYIIPVAIFFNETFNIARQSIAIVYVLLAAVLVNEHKKIDALLLIVFAFFLHPYTFISVVILFIDKIKLTKSSVTILLILTTVIGLIGALSGIQDFLNLLMVATSDSNSELVLRLGKYGHGYEIASEFSLIGQLSHILPLLAMCWLGANERSMKSVYYKMMLTGCLVTNVFVSVIFCERIASTFSIAQILAVPYIYKTSTPRTRFLIILLIVLTAGLYIYNLNGSSLSYDWTEYHTFFTL